MKVETSLLVIAFIITIILGFIIIPILKKLKVGQIESIYFTAKGQNNIANNILPLLLVSIGFGLIGFIDDFKKLVLKNTKGLKPSYKMLGLLIISVAYVVYLVYALNIGTDTYIPIIKQYISLPVYIYIPFAIIVILATTNAINLTDGIDGLSSSVSAIIITCLTVIGILFGSRELGIFGSIVIGAILGFLMFNLHPAKVFMGDTGSLLLGGVISAMALYIKMPLLLIIIALVPVLETLSVIIQVTYFKKTGNRVFKMAPLHHHYELSGWKESKVVIVFSAITLVLCIIGLNVVI